ncbi:uncharacterized protein TRIADDRAFT_54941 [Trichoplax adhaerens]|uniref:ABC transmembrane type-1 domain-containing protein n=1 Tax=Trichoplax adhaerens TaxID=10228 RepID=B3RTE9_TRIAD|nr:hypothetical protein TRIADDRAFT_54941 [Trichoplax adhaerens]EDV27212.1 hypothetical protein TRIADDRAFT_54941 [Trichoplax adhaerens]|eukprot:XP_002111208.1 hypothetical protein TRIADDRAFT_54941 [Trichoplax adhaerens]
MSSDLDKTQINDAHHPYNQAYAFSKYCSFWWLHPLFRIIKQRQLQESDIFPVLHVDSSRKQMDLFERYWSDENPSRDRSRTNNLFKLLIKCYGIPFMGIGIVAFITMSLTVIRPLFVGWLVSYFTPSSQVTAAEAYLYATGLSLVSVLLVLSRQWYFFMTYRFGFRTTVLLSTAIFQKALRLKSSALSRTSIGFIVNLLANDALKMKLAYQFLHMLWIAPFLAITLTALLWQQVGVASLAGLGVLLTLILQQSALVTLLVKFRQKYLKFADKRVRIMNEVISSMRTIKMYAWENSFAKAIRQLRRKEMDRLFSGYAFYALNVASYLLLNTITSFVTIIVYVLMGNTINSSKVFTVYSLLNSLQVALSIGVPEAIRAIIDAKVSFDRIEKHLMLDECKENPGYIQSLESNIGDQLALDNVSASWYNGFSLKDISLTVSHGKLLSIIGPVGGGKTSLLMVLLGELPLSAGTLKY